LYLLQKSSNVCLVLERVLVSQENPEQVLERVLDVHLYEAELLIALVLEDLAEEPDVMIIILVDLNSVDDRDEPLNDEIFQTVLLIEICVNVLFHCFPRLL